MGKDSQLCLQSHEDPWMGSGNVEKELELPEPIHPFPIPDSSSSLGTSSSLLINSPALIVLGNCDRYLSCSKSGMQTAPSPLSCQEHLPALDAGLIPGEGAALLPWDVRQHLAGAAHLGTICSVTSGHARGNHHGIGGIIRTGMRMQDTQQEQRDGTLVWDTAPGCWHGTRWEFQGIFHMGMGTCLGSAGFDLSRENCRAYPRKKGDQEGASRSIIP